MDVYDKIAQLLDINKVLEEIREKPEDEQSIIKHHFEPVSHHRLRQVLTNAKGEVNQTIARYKADNELRKQLYRNDLNYCLASLGQLRKEALNIGTSKNHAQKRELTLHLLQKIEQIIDTIEKLIDLSEGKK